MFGFGDRSPVVVRVLKLRFWRNQSIRIKSSVTATSFSWARGNLEMFSRSNSVAQAALAQVEAISKSQAVIEFNPDGTIVTANENFLKTLGYSLGEIQGKHHSMFVEPAMRESAAYREFWAKLNRGEFQSAEYRRIGKGGKEVWIQASYNPIRDLNGNPYKVVKYATDTTAQVVARMKSESVRGMMESVAAGAEQLNSSVREISEAMVKSKETASAAVDRVEI